MDALLLYLWLVGIVADFPPEPICKLVYEQASQVECRAAKELAFSGSWACRQRWQAADPDRRLAWCAWYCSWGSIDFDEKLKWAMRWHAIARGDERFGVH
jgi:hypothetical protein